MADENRDKIKAIFLEAMALDPTARARFLAEKCGGDDSLRREVEELIRADAEAENPMSRPAIAQQATDFFAALPETADPLIGQMIGAYRLTAELGRGGMGAVYLAERADGEFRRQVAVKLVKRGMDSDFILKRFRQERQVLAALSHPSIARLLDGGTTGDNLPFFVMEYVKGLPLYRYCDDENLSIGERLGLFCRICEAVDYAHQKQIIHRDIKPSNILVKPDGTPKLLDFGIAKALDTEIGISTIDPTATAMRMMTPEYASPEQVSGLPVTFASDIYSLGVVLYELLTGTRPYRFKSRAPHEIARVICEEEPALLRGGEEEKRRKGDKYFEEREVVPSSPLLLLSSSQLGGEIEKVVMKCLRKNPAERYRSAAGLASDVTRYLKGETVQAETFPASVATKKTEIFPTAGEGYFFGNAKSMLGAAALLAVLLAGGLSLYFIFKPEKSGSRTEAQSQSIAKRSVAILPFVNETSKPENDFLCDGLSESLINRLSFLPEIKVMSRSAAFKYKGTEFSPEQAGKDMNVASVLSGKLSRSADKIAVFLELIDVSDGSLIWSAQYDGKESEIIFLQNKMASDVAAQFKTDRSSDPKPAVARGYTENPQAFELYLKGEFERQKASAEGNRRSIEFYRRALEADPNYALAFQGLALSYRLASAHGTLPAEEAYPQAKAAALKALAIDPSLGLAYLALASIKFSYDWDFAGAESEYRQALQYAPNNAETHSSYANFLIAMGRADEALSELRIAQQFDPNSAFISSNIAWALYIGERFDEAEEQLRQLLGRDPQFALAHRTLGEIYAEKGRFDEAVQILQKAEQLSPGAQTETIVAYVYAVSGRRGEALKMAEDLEAKALKKELSPFLMAEVYAGLGERDKAFGWLERAFQERSNWLVFVKVQHRLKPLRGDSRFADLLKRIGFEN